MNARELMTDSPELDVLLDKCMDNDYSVDKFDFFYMQAISERDKLRVPNFNPNDDGHWYGSSVIVAGGLLQSELRQAEYPETILEINRDIIEANVQHEIDSLNGKHTKRGDILYEKKRGMYIELMKLVESNGLDISKSVESVQESFTSSAKSFWDLFKEGTYREAHDHIDFNSPIFASSNLFSPFKEDREYREEELTKLYIAQAHDLHPFTAHLMHNFYVKK